MNLEAVYTTVCYTYLTKNKNATIEDAEKVLFLMQYNRMKKENRKLYDEKTYIRDDEIYIAYISDLLRVMAPTKMTIYPSLFAYSIWQNHPSIHTVIRNEKKAEEYAKLPIDEITRKVNQIIETEELDSYYFVYKPYQNRKRRLFARYRGRMFTRTNLKDTIKFFGYSLLMLLLFPFTMFGLIIPLRALFFTIEIADIIVFTSIFLILFIPWLIITYRWTRPTDFEIENDYLSERRKK